MDTAIKKTKLVVRHCLLTYSGKARLAYYILLRLSAGSLMPPTCFFTTSCLLCVKYMLNRLSKAVDQYVWLGMLAQTSIFYCAFGKTKTSPEIYVPRSQCCSWKKSAIGSPLFGLVSYYVLPYHNFSLVIRIKHLKHASSLFLTDDIIRNESRSNVPIYCQVSGFFKLMLQKEGGKFDIKKRISFSYQRLPL